MDDNTTYSPSGQFNLEDVPQWFYASMFAASVIVIVGAVFGNILTIVAVFRDETLKKIGNSFIVSLAISDLLMAVLIMPPNAVFTLLQNDHPSYICVPTLSGDLVLCSASVLNISCISIDRYIAITDPLHYSTRMTKKLAAVMITCSWLMSILSGLALVIAVYYRAPEDGCASFFTLSATLIGYCINICLAIIPMLFAYWVIFRIARKQEAQVIEMTVEVGRQGNPEYSTMQRRKSHKAAKTLALIIGGFMLCLLPFVICSFVSFLVPATDIPVVIWSIVGWLVYCNCVLNPLIYAATNRDFRKAFKRLLCKGIL